jgi:putative transposase
VPRRVRHVADGHVWHITHRCHDQAFLLRFARDRQAWQHWLREARLRYDLCVLNFIVTCNHIHLLVRDRGDNAIASSMQLIAGATAQAYNRRKNRRGAFWEDRYRVTAVESGRHLARCLVYIDLNMVRAGAVAHPAEWAESGYQELQRRRSRYRVINQRMLCDLLHVRDVDALQQRHADWIAAALARPPLTRDRRWTQSLAVGSLPFLARIAAELGLREGEREVVSLDEDYVLRESAAAYDRMPSGGTYALLAHNTVLTADPAAGQFPTLQRPVRSSRA